MDLLQVLNGSQSRKRSRKGTEVYGKSKISKQTGENEVFSATEINAIEDINNEPDDGGRTPMVSLKTNMNRTKPKKDFKLVQDSALNRNIDSLLIENPFPLSEDNPMRGENYPTTTTTTTTTTTVSNPGNSLFARMMAASREVKLAEKAKNSKLSSESRRLDQDRQMYDCTFVDLDTAPTSKPGSLLNTIYDPHGADEEKSYFVSLKLDMNKINKSNLNAVLGETREIDAADNTMTTVEEANIEKAKEDEAWTDSSGNSLFACEIRSGASALIKQASSPKVNNMKPQKFESSENLLFRYDGDYQKTLILEKDTSIDLNTTENDDDNDDDSSKNKPTFFVTLKVNSNKHKTNENGAQRSIPSNSIFASMMAASRSSVNTKPSLQGKKTKTVNSQSNGFPQSSRDDRSPKRINQEKIEEIDSSRNIQNKDNTNTMENNVSQDTQKVSLFASMMSASRNAFRLNPLQKLKELEPPHLKPTEFLILDHQRRPSPSLVGPTKQKRKNGVFIEEFSGLCPSTGTKTPTPEYLYEIKDDDLADCALKKLPRLQKYPPLRAVFDLIGQQNSSELWVNKFQPVRMDQLLIHKESINQVRNWIGNSFLKMKSQAPVQGVNRYFKTKQNNSFIVYDDEDTEDEGYSPILILQGSCGSGKSTAVHTAMKELNGYVHEINSGMSRGRKDIFNDLKELCTTQLVHDTNGFQKGIILFEDVNVLFEQDKSFWTVVQDLIKVSRRPIVITCEELWNIPNTLVQCALEDDSIIYLDDFVVSRKLVLDYLWLCCLVNGFDVEDAIIGQIIDENWNGNNYDLRRSLAACEMMCKVERRGKLIVIKKNKPDLKNLTSTSTLDSASSSTSATAAATAAAYKDELQAMSIRLDLKSCLSLVKEEHIDTFWFLPNLNHDNNNYDNNDNNNNNNNDDDNDDDDDPVPKFHFNNVKFEYFNFIESRSRTSRASSFPKTN
ncbi:hypothetical protein KGF56_000270 [Candida oxycetoniae]|uniref:Uncharacterized protein n=1 Tax=Candida oxycetoniae TaxID=497107 RepID=A0AAI9T207_9ASCO|nr:uncharacterized protein KGF56_000270 [Candida oxycetoniae]KAI3406977.2 hypothetical protein KGF56_000270 [Candida oxycetoniae]